MLPRLLARILAGAYSLVHVIYLAFPPGIILPQEKGLYNLPAFFIHAASLRQACAHCGRFLAAASRRSLGRVSVPVWPITLSGRLSIVALVGSYPTNKLMDRRLIFGRRIMRLSPLHHSAKVVSGITLCFHRLSPTQR